MRGPRRHAGSDNGSGAGMKRPGVAVRNAWRAPYGLRDTVIVMAVVVAASCAAPGAAVWADHSPTSCILHVRGESHPVTYLGEPRQNPDGTYYPGDAFYYIFRWEDRSDEPGDCTVHAPLLESGRLLLGHHAVRVDGEGRMFRSAPLTHTDLDPAVGFLSETDFYAGKMQTECQVSFAKPGESWRTRWEQWAVYDRVFLTKDGTDRLTEFEKTLKSKAYRGEPAWEWWEEKGKMRSGHSELPECPFKSRPGDPGEPQAGLPGLPAYMRHYGDGIFYAMSYVWGIMTDSGNASHAHLAATPADPGSMEWFEERVQEMCGKYALSARSGCVYGTAEIRPDGGVCVSDAVDSYARLLDAWHLKLPPYDITGADGRPVESPPGPPPGYPASSWGHLLANRTHPFDVQTPPPGIAPGMYEGAPAGDICATASFDGSKLEMTISGTYTTPHHRANDIPVKGVKKVARDVGPPLQDGELLVILTKPPLHHMEGYDAKNLDGTYYHGDPIYVRHEPSWKWKDERSAHIDFATHRLSSSLLPIIDKFDCPPPPASADVSDTAASAPYMTAVLPCEYAIGVDSPPWLAEKILFGNGDGLTVRTADASHGFGTYAFSYNMTAHNLGRQVADATNSTEAEVVLYEPSYETVYSYLVLADAREYAFDDRHGIAMRYGGSWQDDVLHTMRRSFINGWDGAGGGHDPYTFNRFGQEHVLGTGRNASPNHAALEHAQDTQTAMFARSGHGTILFEWPVSGWVFSAYNQTTAGKPAAATAAKAAVYENVTAHLQVYSRDFADKDTILYETVMRYPEMPFTKHVTVQSVDHAGVIQATDDITFRVTPYVELGAEYLTDYISDKITWDTDDPIIAQIVVNDTHPMVQEWRASNGVVNAAVLRTSVHFGDITMQNEAGLQFSGRLADFHKLAEHPETLRLTAPYDLGLSVLAPTSLHITINGSGEHAIHHKYYSFGGNETISINVQKDSQVDVTRESGRIIIGQPENFGIIKRVEINGTRLQQPCPIGCTVSFQPDTTLEVTLYNEWGGEAHGTVDTLRVSNTSQTNEPRWQVIGIAVILLTFSYVVYKKITKKS